MDEHCVHYIHVAHLPKGTFAYGPQNVEVVEINCREQRQVHTTMIHVSVNNHVAHLHSLSVSFTLVELLLLIHTMEGEEERCYIYMHSCK